MITHQPSFTAAGKGGVPTNPPPFIVWGNYGDGDGDDKFKVSFEAAQRKRSEPFDTWLL